MILIVSVKEILEPPPSFHQRATALAARLCVCVRKEAQSLTSRATGGHTHRQQRHEQQLSGGIHPRWGFFPRPKRGQCQPELSQPVQTPGFWRPHQNKNESLLFLLKQMKVNLITVLPGVQM